MRTMVTVSMEYEPDDLENMKEVWGEELRFATVTEDGIAFSFIVNDEEVAERIKLMFRVLLGLDHRRDLHVELGDPPARTLAQQDYDHIVHGTEYDPEE